MGKSDNQRLPVVQQQQQQHTHGSSSPTSLCGICSINFFDFNCVVVLVLGVAAFLSAIFWFLPNRCGKAGFDADVSIKISGQVSSVVSGFLIGEVETSSLFLKPKGQISTVQACFKLQRQSPELVPNIARLEYDINEEIGVPFFKVAALSMHQAGVSNWTNVVFGFCSNVSNNPISPVSLSVLKS